MKKLYSFADGKYAIIRDSEDYGMRACRNGEHWPTRTVDLIGDKLVSSMLDEIDKLQEYIAHLEKCV